MWVLWPCTELTFIGAYFLPAVIAFGGPSFLSLVASAASHDASLLAHPSPHLLDPFSYAAQARDSFVSWPLYVKCSVTPRER